MKKHRQYCESKSPQFYYNLCKCMVFSFVFCLSFFVLFFYFSRCFFFFFFVAFVFKLWDKIGLAPVPSWNNLYPLLYAIKLWCHHTEQWPRPMTSIQYVHLYTTPQKPMLLVSVQVSATVGVQKCNCANFQQSLPDTEKTPNSPCT